jgi:hypothetical protein
MVMVVAASLGTVYAQDATATPDDTDTTTDGMVTCDADLVLLLYVAERFFDFDSFSSQVSADMMVDIDNIDKGQYQPLFDNMSDKDTMQMSDETRSAMSDMMAMSDTDFGARMNEMMMSGSDMSMLTVRTLTDEAQECAALRRSLHRFFTALALNDAEMGGIGTGTQTDATTDTSTDTTDTSTDTGVAAGIIAVNLSGAAEVPAMGDEDASGTATVYLRADSNEVCVDISVQNITLPATAAHIHQAPAGQAGPPVVTLNAPGENGSSNTCATVEASLMQDMVNNPANYYVNVHNEEFPDGAARGQLN